MPKPTWTSDLLDSRQLPRKLSCKSACALSQEKGTGSAEELKRRLPTRRARTKGAAGDPVPWPAAA